MVGEERTGRPRRTARDRSLSAAERESDSPRRVRLAAPPASQVDDADMLQRAGGDLPGLDGRGRAGPRRAPRARTLSRSTLLYPRWSRLSHLHGRLAFLRGESLAGISQDRTAHLMALSVTCCKQNQSVVIPRHASCRGIRLFLGSEQGEIPRFARNDALSHLFSKLLSPR